MGWIYYDAECRDSLLEEELKDDTDGSSQFDEVEPEDEIDKVAVIIGLCGLAVCIAIIASIHLRRRCKSQESNQEV